VSGQPLVNKTIVVTRAQHQAGRLSGELEALGAHVIELPTIEIAAPDSYEPLDAALRNLRQYQWLVVTSANTVRVLCERMELLGLTEASFAGIRSAAVGQATAQALQKLGLRVDAIPKEYVGESLVEALRAHVSGARILLARAAVARDVVPEALRRLGATVDIVDAYKTVIPAKSAALLREIFTEQILPDAITFTSSSTASNFFQLLHDAGLERSPEALRAVSIGPVTSATLRKLGWVPSAEADPHDVPGLVQAVIRALS
jgi:uroporphyrinogen-III synthase